MNVRAEIDDVSRTSRRRVVLVVGLQEHVLNAVRRGLSPLDCAVITAANNQEAMGLVQTGRFDLIIAQNLPGIDLCQQLRDARSECPFMLLIGKSDDKVILKAMSMSIDCNLSVPFNPRELEVYARSIFQYMDKCIPEQ